MECNKRNVYYLDNQNSHLVLTFMTVFLTELLNKLKAKLYKLLKQKKS